MLIYNLVPLFFYVQIFFLYILYFIYKRYYLRKLLSIVLVSVIIVHAGFIIYQYILFKKIIEINSPSAFLSYLSLALIVIYLYIEQKIKVKSTGFLVVGIALLFQVASFFIRPQREIVNSILQSNFVVFHTVTAIFGYAGFCISAIYGLLYVLLLHDIKLKNFSIIYSRLPSLEKLSLMNFKACFVGFIFLSISLPIGVFWFLKNFGADMIIDPKIITAFVIWFLFGLNCFSKKTFAKGGVFSAYLSSFGFLIILFSVVFAKYILPTFHAFN